MKLFVVFSYLDFTEYGDGEFGRFEDYDDGDNEGVVVGVFSSKKKAKKCVEDLRETAHEYVLDDEGDEDIADEMVEEYFDYNVGIREIDLDEYESQIPEFDEDDDEVWEDEE